MEETIKNSICLAINCENRASSGGCLGFQNPSKECKVAKVFGTVVNDEIFIDKVIDDDFMDVLMMVYEDYIHEFVKMLPEYQKIYPQPRRRREP